jgi:lipopolysaccharide export LptBFGC system permease protein LptF
MTGRLDGYVRRTVLGAFGACLLFMVLLSTLIDILLNLGDYLDAASEQRLGTIALLGNMAWYYLVSVPIVFVTVSPFVTVIAGMFAVSRLMGANEIVPMLFTGRSITRVLRPVLTLGCLSALATAACWELVISTLAETLNDVRGMLTAQHGEQGMKNLVVTVRGERRQTLFCSRYFHDRLRMESVSVVDEDPITGETALVQATAANWDPSIGDWDLEAGERRTARLATRQERLGMAEVTPDLLWRTGREGREAVELSYSELLELQALRPGRRDLVLQFHSHLTFPLANVVLLLLALPFAVHFERGSRIERVLFAILVCGLYLVTDLTCQNLGQSTLHPVLAAWLPTILFGSIGVSFYSGIRT